MEKNMVLVNEMEIGVIGDNNPWRLGKYTNNS